MNKWIWAFAGLVLAVVVSVGGYILYNTPKTVATASLPAGVLTLHDKQGKCPEGQKQGSFAYRHRNMVISLCWAFLPQGIGVIDEHGDAGIVPFNLFEKAP